MSNVSNVPLRGVYRCLMRLMFHSEVYTGVECVQCSTERGIQVSNVSNVPLRGVYGWQMCLMFH